MSDGRGSGREKAGAVMVTGLALAFLLFFQSTKQDPTLAAVNASAIDPFDAVGSFGIQAAAFCAALSLLRAFRRGGGTSMGTRAPHLLRAEMAVVLTVAVTLAGDVVAMARQPSLWVGSRAGTEYAVLLGVIAALTLATAAYVGRVAAGPASPPPGAWARAGVVGATFVAVLAVYPSSLTSSTPGALFTVLAGVLLLFLPVRALLAALVPRPADGSSDVGREPGPSGPARGARPWAVVVGAGLVAGVLLVAVEFTSGPGAAAPPLASLLFVASVYVGLETAGLLIGYALLRGPLDLMIRPRACHTGPSGAGIPSS